MGIVYDPKVSGFLEHFGSGAFCALEQAERGLEVSLVCSGDAGVYGLAGLIISMGKRQYPETQIEIIPGVTAALSGIVYSSTMKNYKK